MGYFDEAIKAKNKKLTQGDIEKSIKEKKCPFCGSENFNATILALRDFWFDEKGQIEWGDDIDQSGDMSNLLKNPTIICKICVREIPKEVWEKWFEEGSEE